MPVTSQKVTPNFYYPDGSGFCFDLPPWEAVYGGRWSEGGFYDLPQLPQWPAQDRYTGWTNWVDKFGLDYRFAGRTDYNAEANVFPEVQDPWEFTHYIFEGTLSPNDLGGSVDPVGITHPPIIRPWVVTRQQDGDQWVSALQSFVDKPATFVHHDQRTLFTIEHRWRSEASNETYWESELAANGWVEPNASFAGNRHFERLNETRRVPVYAVPTVNSGVRLYHQSVWSAATRWGHSQNVPARTLNMTAPRSYLRASSRFTGRIVPHVTIKQGTPIYDNLTSPASGQQRVILYENVVLAPTWGNDARIGLQDVTPTGFTHDPSATFAYSVPDDLTGSDLVRMPQVDARVTTRLSVTDVPYQTGDLVHRGCAFWQGSAGQARCTLYQQQSVLFPTTSHTFTYPTVASLAGVVMPFTVTADEAIEIWAEHSLHGRRLLRDCNPHIRAVVSGNQVSLLESFTGADYPVVTHSPPLGGGAGLWGGTTVSGEVKIIIQKRLLASPLPEPVKCAMYDGATATDARRNYSGQCSFYTPQGPRSVLRYEGQAANGAEWANMQKGLPPGYKRHPLETSRGKAAFDLAQASLGLPTGMGMLGNMMFMASMNAIATPDPYVSGLDSEGTIEIEVTYEAERVAIDRKESYYDTPDGLPDRNSNDPESDLRVREGTGFHPLDSKSHEPLPGVDSVFFENANQINYRLTHNVMSCYRPERCDHVIATAQASTGFRRGQYSNIDFTGHDLRVPGYPAFNGTSRYCFYGNSRCPAGNPDRRAVEFDGNYQILLNEILVPFRMQGFEFFRSTYGLREGLLGPTGLEVILPGQEPSEATAGSRMCVAVLPDSSTPPLMGHWQPVIQATDPEDNQVKGFRVFFYFDRLSTWSGHTDARIAAHLVQFDDEDRAQHVTNLTGSDLTEFNTVFGADAKVPWLIELLDGYRSPRGNLTQVTNPLPFAGGRGPEYKDHSRRGREIVCRFGGYGSDLQAGNQFGGDQWANKPVRSVTRRGYWTDADGEFIVHGTAAYSLPEFNGSVAGFAPVELRINNKPVAYGNAPPIDGVPGLSLADREQPGFNRRGDYAAIGATFANDTKELIDWFHAVAYVDSNTGRSVTNWESLLPEDPMSTTDPPAKVPVAPPRRHWGENPDFVGLPRERFVYQCPTCGIAYTEEEFKYFRTISTLVEGDSAKCPRADGGILAKVTGDFNRILPSTARGEVHVWAPPGSTVRRDALFWKNPTMVSRLHVDQAYQKLGAYNAAGGGYTFAHISPALEKLGRLPVVGAFQHHPGVTNQLVFPFASSGESVATVRGRVSEWFDLHSGDRAYVIRAAGRTLVSNESTFNLATGDTLQFERPVSATAGLLIGVNISVSSSLPQALRDQLPTPLTPMPQASSFDSPIQYVTARRQWILDAAQGTLQHWSSATSLPPNAMANQLLAAGSNPNHGQSFDPRTGQVVPVDERVASPYSKTEAGGLQMVTMTKMQQFRNRILPMLAYDLSLPTYTAGGDFSPQQQAANSNRFSRRRKDMPFPTFGTIDPQVMAATSTGKDFYFEWDVGDVMGSKDRAYYPVGPTWWRMTQNIGQIRRSGGTNPLHLDDSLQAYTDSYTGDTITSVCALFMHGRIPLDKEVVKAYIVFDIDDGPHVGPVGCQGQYNGEVAIQSSYSGQTGPSAYVGSSSCFWGHFHPWDTNHEGDIGSFNQDSDLLGFTGDIRALTRSRSWGASNGFSGPASRRHAQGQVTVTPGWTPASEDQVLMFPQGADFNGWPAGPTPSWQTDDAALYLDATSILGVQFVDRSFGFDFSQEFLGPWSWGSDLTQLVTEHQVWKDIDFQRYESLQSTYSAKVTMAANTVKARANFLYFAEEFRKKYFPHEHQAIPGWIDFSDYDTSGRFDRRIPVEEKEVDHAWANGPQVIVQSEDLIVQPGLASGGGGGSFQGGATQRVLDWTDECRRLYNDRVSRFYRVKTGASWSELYPLTLGRTDSNLQYHTEYREGPSDEWPGYEWNYRYIKPSIGMWLNDPWHMPPMTGDQIRETPDNGDPVSQDDADRRRRIDFVTDWFHGDDEEEFHPWQLCMANTESVTWLDNAAVPEESSYWLVRSREPNTQWFSINLAQTPYELTRRGWRFQRPETDSSSATCPNPSCFVHQNGWTVGEFFQNATTSLGMDIIPSTTSSWCAACHTELEGVIQTGGDGIVTVDYAGQDEPDTILRQIEVDTAVTGGETIKHGFTIESFHSVTKQWRVLFEVRYDEIEEEFVFLQWDGTAWQTRRQATLPTVIDGSEGRLHNNALAPSVAGSHFIAVPASKIRFKVTRPHKIARSTGWINCSGGPTSREVSIPVASLGANAGVIQEIVYCQIGMRKNNGDEIHSDVTQVVLDGANLHVRTSSDATDITSVNISWDEYVTRCSRLRVYGYPYREGEVVVTPPGSTQMSVLTSGSSEVRLGFAPTQIQRVDVAAGDQLGIPMVESDVIDSTFHWTVTTDSYAGQQFLRITGGKWHYDWNRNTVRLPDTFIDPVTQRPRNIWSLNEEIYTDPSNEFRLETVPRLVTIEYLVGIGSPVDCDIEAIGDGPSYQLDRECISFILGHSPDSEAAPAGVTTSQLPPMGSSVRLKNAGGNRLSLHWQVYNHEPITWNGTVDWLSGNELGPGQWGDSDVLNLFSGNRGTDLSDLGPNARIHGKATGRVTLYGPPSTILSGDVVAYAKATTRRQFQTPNGPVITYERTGGLRSGAVVARLLIDHSGPGRKSVSARVPRVLIYLREREMTSPI